MTLDSTLRRLAPALLASAALTATPTFAQSAPLAGPDLSVDDMIEPLVSPKPEPSLAEKATFTNDELDPSTWDADDLIEPIKGKPAEKPAKVQTPEDATFTDDELDPSTWDSDDLLGPLTGKTAEKAAQADVTEYDPLEIDVELYQQELAEQEAERRRREAEREKDEKKPRTDLVQRSYFDQCASFTVSWGRHQEMQADAAHPVGAGRPR